MESGRFVNFRINTHIIEELTINNANSHLPSEDYMDWLFELKLHAFHVKLFKCDMSLIRTYLLLKCV